MREVRWTDFSFLQPTVSVKIKWDFDFFCNFLLQHPILTQMKANFFWSRKYLV